MTVFGCGSCICRICLLWWSNRCPYGGCWDEHRARINPYDQAHPDDPPRKEWSNWATDQAYWCRGGVFYPTDKCEHFIKYDEAATQVQDCLQAPVTKYQDGYIRCSLVESVGCEECYRQWERRMEHGDE